MALDVIQLQAFYASPLGQVARRILSARLRSLWPDLRGFALAGVGYASAYLPIFRDETDRTIALMPAAQGVAVWPRQGPSASALIDPLMLPLGDASLDRAIIVHALEASGNPKELLSEIWQTLKPGGQIIVIAPIGAGCGRGSTRRLSAKASLSAALSSPGFCARRSSPPRSRRRLCSCLRSTGPSSCARPWLSSAPDMPCRFPSPASM